MDLSALMEQLYQEKQATDLKVFERQRQSLRDQSRIMASAGEAGVGGGSLQRILENQQWDLAHDTGIYKTNLQNTGYMTAQHAQAVAANMDNRINTATGRMRNPWIDVALSIPSVALSGYQTYQGVKKGGG